MADETQPRPVRDEKWQVAVALSDLKFSAAHFVAFEGFREPLHGHNYTVGLRIGSHSIQADGYVVDFGDLKKAARDICRRLNHRTLLPAQSNVLRLQQGPDLVEVFCQQGVKMVLPLQDCLLLPVVHTTAEELAEYIAKEVISRIGGHLRQRRCDWIEVQVSERPGQGAFHMASLASDVVPVSLRRTPRPCMSPVSGMDGIDDSLEEVQLVTPSRPLALPQSQPGASIAEEAFRQILSTLGPQESSRPELRKTPYRAAKAFREMTAGLQVQDPLVAVGEGIFEVEGAQDLVAVRDIPFHSMCEHHLLPFSGTAHVAYFPDGRVLGLSKFARLLQVFARRLQLQERLSQQFAEALDQLLSPKAVAVSLEANHCCMSHRGASVPSSTRTLVFRGMQKDDPDLKQQLLLGISRGAASRL
mmetsp:Transcript_68047/g.162419  ORF Transcript_68047/g.162419 Transcript_68047/m.162419 type:complete len:416 (-) Transcript_68047:101-1348(-)